MIKRILLSALAIAAMSCVANAEVIVAYDLLYRTAQLPDNVQDNSPESYSCRIRVDNNMIYFEQRGYHFIADFIPYCIKADVTDGTINIIWENSNHIPDILGSRTEEVSFSIPLIANQNSPEEYLYNVNFNNFKTDKPLNLSPGAEYLLNGTEDGKIVISEGWPTHELFTSRTDTEWVLYNEALGVDDMFRIRLGNPIGDNEDRLWPVLLCRGNAFDKAQATTIARIGGATTHYRVYPENTEIPAEFWGKGLPQSSYNPASLIKSSRVMYDFWFNQGYVADTQAGFRSNFYFDVVNNRFTELEYHGGYYDPENTGAYFHTVLDNGGKKVEWIEGIGAVGEDYASNLPYPVYNLPEGVTPTRLLYVRDTTTNEIIYGDPTLDKLYQGSADVSSQTVADSPVVSTKWYDFTGRILPKQPTDSPCIRVDLHADGTTTTSRHLPTK